MAKDNGKELSTTTRRQELENLANYGKKVGRQGNVIGKFLKYNKGDYLAGQDDEEIALGTRMIVNVDSALVGWTLWLDKKNVEQDMGQIIKGFQSKPRSELSMSDRNDWPLDDRGQPRDPWQHGNLCLMRSEKTGELYTFTTTSHGGKSALGKLIDAASQHMLEGNEEYPIVELGTESYKHSEWGRINKPTFEIVGWWSPIEDFMEEAASTTKAKAKAPVSKSAAAPASKSAAKGKSSGRALTYK